MKSMRDLHFAAGLAIAWCILVCSSALNAIHAEAKDVDQHFDSQVAPLLAKRCLTCHSGNMPKGELDLSSMSTFSKGGSSGTAVVAGKAQESLLWQQIDSDTMPPKQPLSSAEKEIIKSWIEAGAKWGSDPIDVFQYSSDARAGRDWWSLQPLHGAVSHGAVSHGGESHEGEALRDSPTRANPIDGFVEQARQARQLSASPPADKRTLIRRLTFDLLGLPPTPEEVERFLTDESPQAYEALVDRLLESPHYGERWARHWLDVVRFGESNGFEYDEPRDNFWHYRNWVIDAFNADMPYDEFVKKQIAGDALHPNDVRAAAAAGFLVAGPHNTTLPANTKMRQAMAQDEMEDLLGSIGQTFLGLTINCARCHDHKFDPISQKEYYQLAAALSGVTHGQRTLHVSLSQPQRERLRQIDQSLGATNTSIESIIGPVRDQLRKQRESADVSQAEKLRTTQPPVPTATWEFDGDLRDSKGKLALEASGGAAVQDGALVLDGKTAYAASPLLEEPIGEKTLEVWLKLNTLDQRGGGAISIETKDGIVFDAIVFGEREPKKWMAGSNNFARSKSFQVDAEESTAVQQAVHIALVYRADGTIAAYRNGQPYGAPYNSGGLQRFDAGGARLVFGTRHTPPGGNRLLAGRIERAQFTNRALTSEEVELSAAFQEIGNIPRSMIVKQLEDGARQQLEKLEAAAKQLLDEKNLIEKSQYQTLYTCVSTKPAPTHVLLRGDVGTPAEAVQPAGLRAVSGTLADWQLDDSADDHRRRIKLAEWVTDRNNPLLSRVIVNRLWQYHFGQGLVATPSDFGFNGGQPTHPELLNWLAGELIRKGFRLKPLHRLIVSSQTYQQSSQPNAEAMKVDADNRYLWRKSPMRIEAETLRDAILVVTNRLDRQVGGNGYRDMRHYFFKGSHFYELLSETGPDARRRTIYRFTPRGNQNPFLSTFDCPDPSATTPRRPVTTTPLQALALLNNAMIFDLADHFAKRIESQAVADVGQQVQTAYEIAYGRPATADEVSRGQKFVEQQDLAAFGRVIFNSNEFLYVR